MVKLNKRNVKAHAKYDKIFSLTGMNYLVRKMANLAHPTFIFERVSDNQIKVVNRTTFMENTTIYTYGEPATVKNPNGETLVSD